MKKKLRLLPVLLILSALACGAYALSSGDGLVSLAHLTQVFFPEAQKQGEAAVQEKLQPAYDEAKKQLDAIQAEALGRAALYSDTLEGKDWSDGDVVTLPTGSGFLLLEGTARVEHGGAVVDVTAGSELASGVKLTAGHRCLVGEDTSAKVTILSGAAVMGVQGEYSYTPGRADAAPFYDVCRTDWYYDAVNFVYHNKIFSGTGAGRFEPEMTMDRSMMITVLYHLAGSPEGEMSAARASFTDVPETVWYAPYVRWGASQGITAGTGDGTTFSPKEKITREQVAAILYNFGSNYLGMDLPERADLSGYQDLSQSSGWAREALSWAAARGILKSTSSDRLTMSARRDASRAEVADMVQSFSRAVLEG